jgi:flagellar protein FliS
MKTKTDAYRYADTMGKSPLELVLMVYDGAIRAMRVGADHFRHARSQPGRDEVQKAGRMVIHLYTTLDNEKGGQVAANLGRMYTWVINQLQLIEATKDAEQLETVADAMDNLRSGWVDLKARQMRGPRAPSEKSADSGIKVSEHVLTTA